MVDKIKDLDGLNDFEENVFDLPESEELEKYGVWVKSGPEDVIEETEEDVDLQDLGDEAQPDLTDEEEELLGSLDEKSSDFEIPDMPDLPEEDMNFAESETDSLTEELPDLETLETEENMNELDELDDDFKSGPAPKKSAGQDSLPDFDDIEELEIDAPVAAPKKASSKAAAKEEDFTEVSLDDFVSFDEDEETEAAGVPEETEDRTMEELNIDKDLEELDTDLPELEESLSGLDTELEELSDGNLSDISEELLEDMSEDELTLEEEPLMETMEEPSRQIEIGGEQLDIDSDLEEIDIASLEESSFGEELPEPAFDTPEPAAKSIKDTAERESDSILSKIERELLSIKEELSSLKKELINLRTEPAAAAPAPAPEEKKGKSFFDEDEDETIALTGDELDNILSTAEITEAEMPAELDLEEAASDAGSVPDLMDFETEEELPEIPELEDEEIPSISDTEFPELEEEEDLIPLDEEKPHTLKTGTDSLDDINPDELILEDGEDFSADEELMETIPEDVPQDEKDLLGDTELEEVLFDDELPEISIEEEEIDISDSIPEIGSGEEILELPEMEEEAEELEADEEIEEMLELDIPEESSGLPDLEEELDEIEEAEITEEENDLIDDFENMEADIEEIDITSDDETEVMQEEPAEELEMEELEESTEDEDSEPIPSKLKSEIKSVLSYMDQLLEALPEEKIQEFARSEHFEVYKRLFDELGIK
jgi:hypothetical protein